MHSYITPDVSTPCSTACLQPAGAADRVDRAHVVAVAAFDRLAGVRGRRRATCRTAPARRRGRRARCRRAARRRSRRGSAPESASPPPVCTTTGPATTAMRPPAALTSRIIAAMRDTPTSTRRSDEISLVMNAKPMPIALLELGNHANAVDAADDRVALPDVAQLAARRARRLR